jgi:hypothetical protein
MRNQLIFCLQSISILTESALMNKFKKVRTDMMTRLLSKRCEISDAAQNAREIRPARLRFSRHSLLFVSFSSDFLSFLALGKLPRALHFVLRSDPSLPRFIGIIHYSDLRAFVSNVL